MVTIKYDSFYKKKTIKFKKLESFGEVLKIMRLVMID